MGEDRTLDAQLTKLIDGVFREWDSTTSPGCALGIYLDGEIAYSRGYGMSNLEHDVPIRPDSIFHVASISKQFAAHCIVLLAKEGKLALDDDVREYIPELPDYGHKITIQHLIHHTSGLRDQWELLDLAGWRDDDLITDDDALEIATRQAGLNFAPSDQYFYSNTGYTFLGLIIQRITGKSLRQFADERIFQPLAMTRTHFHNDHSEIVAGRTQAYVPRDGGAGYSISIPVFDTTGATSLHTTVEDLFLWNQYLERWLADDANDPYMRTAVLNDGRHLDYGCGLRYGVRHGLHAVGHSGADAGYRAHFITVPEHRIGIAVLCNLSAIAPGPLADEVLGILVENKLGGVLQPEQEIIELSAEALAARSGIYRGLRSGAVLQIEVDEDALVLSLMGGMKLRPVSEDSFVNHQFFPMDLQFATEPESGKLRVEIEELDTFERVAEGAIELEDLTAYAGHYHSEELGVDYELINANNELHWTQRRFEPRSLKPVLEDTFVRNGRWFEFERDANGAVSGFTVSSMRARGIRFERVHEG